MAYKARLTTLTPRFKMLDQRIVKPLPKEADSFYSSTGWRSLLAQIINERGRRCEDPNHWPSDPRSGVRIYGDHIVEIKDGGARLDRNNIMLRCAPCHTRKTIAERNKRLAKNYARTNNQGQ